MQHNAFYKRFFQHFGAYEMKKEKEKKKLKSLSLDHRSYIKYT